MKRISAVILAAIMILCFAACSKNSDKDNYPVKIANYTFEEQPDSVVCLSDSVADIIIACGYASSIKGRSDECTQDEIAAVNSVGTKSSPNTQKILELSPDVVFADKTLDKNIIDKLKKEDVIVLTMAQAKNSEQLTSLYGNICALLNGNVTGRKNGESKAGSILITMDDLQRIIPEKEVVITACYLYDTDGNCADNDTFCGKLFSYANAVNIAPESAAGLNIFESISRSDPQYIFCDKGVKQKIENDERFKNFSAVKSGNIYEIDRTVFERQGNSITQVLSYIIETMYPEISSTSQNLPESSDTQNSKNESSDESSEESSDDESSDESSEESSNDESSDESSEESSSDESSDESSTTALQITDDMKYSLYDEDDNIRIIQERLIELGYMNDSATGYYGGVTTNAVEDYEEANGLTVDGTLDSDDLRLLFSNDAVPAGE